MKRLKQKSKNRYYVYILYYEDGTTPFYVGKGCGERWKHHLKLRGTNLRKNDVIQKILSSSGQVKVEKVRVAMSNSAALALEKELIAKIGRFPKGPLLNRTSGGQDLLLTESARENISSAAHVRANRVENKVLIARRFKGFAWAPKGQKRVPLCGRAPRGPVYRKGAGSRREK